MGCAPPAPIGSSSRPLKWWLKKNLHPVGRCAILKNKPNRKGGDKVKEIQEMDELEIRKELEFARMARDILESLDRMLAIDKEGKIVFASKSWCRIVGRKQEDVIGAPLRKIVAANQLSVLIERKQRGEFTKPVNYFVPRFNDIRRAMIVYPDGNREDENIVGAVGFGILDSGDGIYARSRTMQALENLFLSDSVNREHGAAGFQHEDAQAEDILGVSADIHVMKTLIERVAPSNVSVCILGETGTGKELVSNAIHAQSKRSDKPFVKINCAAIPKDLMESELFGYEPGAFTGASRQGKIGKFEAASGGTLLLDEIAEMPLDLQAKLLRVLQSREVVRLGGTKPIPVDVRLICATNRDLKKMVEEGKFRADLYYRINAIEIGVPPLRDRPKDIPMLVSRFIEVFNRDNGLSVEGISDAALALLGSHDWPGNVRELENAVGRACILCGEGQLDIQHFSILAAKKGREKVNLPQPGREAYRPVTEGKHDPVPDSIGPLPYHATDAQEKEMIARALEACRGKRNAAAELLGIARSTLYLKMKKYNL